VDDDDDDDGDGFYTCYLYKGVLKLQCTRFMSVKQYCGAEIYFHIVA
jgi:hypothetical protein